MDRIDGDGENKTQRLYICSSNYALSKLTVNNGLEDLWRRENPDSSEFSHYNKSSGTRSRIGMVYIDVRIANNTKINHIMAPFTDHYNDISLDRLLLKTKIGKD